MGERQQACTEARLKDIAEHLRQGLSSNLAHTVEHLQQCLSRVLASADDASSVRRLCVTAAVQTSPASHRTTTLNEVGSAGQTIRHSICTPSDLYTAPSSSLQASSTGKSLPDSAEKRTTARSLTASEVPTDVCTQAVPASVGQQGTASTVSSHADVQVDASTVSSKDALSSELIAWFEQEALQHYMLLEAALSHERASLQSRATEKITRARAHRQQLHRTPSEVHQLEQAECLVASQLAADLAAIDQRLQLARRNLQQQQLCWGLLQRCSVLPLSARSSAPASALLEVAQAEVMPLVGCVGEQTRKEPVLRSKASQLSSEVVHAGALPRELDMQQREKEGSMVEDVHSNVAASEAAPSTQIPPTASLLHATELSAPEHVSSTHSTASLNAATQQLAAHVAQQRALVAAREASVAKQAELRAELVALQRRAAELDRELGGDAHFAMEVPCMGTAAPEHHSSVDSVSMVASEVPDAHRVSEEARHDNVKYPAENCCTILDTIRLCSSSSCAKPLGEKRPPYSIPGTCATESSDIRDASIPGTSVTESPEIGVGSIVTNGESKSSSIVSEVHGFSCSFLPPADSSGWLSKEDTSPASSTCSVSHPVSIQQQASCSAISVSSSGYSGWGRGIAVGASSTAATTLSSPEASMDHDNVSGSVCSSPPQTASGRHASNSNASMSMRHELRAPDSHAEHLISSTSGSPEPRKFEIHAAQTASSISGSFELTASDSHTEKTVSPMSPSPNCEAECLGDPRTVNSASCSSYSVAESSVVIGLSHPDILGVSCVDSGRHGDSGARGFSDSCEHTCESVSCESTQALHHVEEHSGRQTADEKELPSHGSTTRIAQVFEAHCARTATVAESLDEISEAPSGSTLQLVPPGVPRTDEVAAGKQLREEQELSESSIHTDDSVISSASQDVKCEVEDPRVKPGSGIQDGDCVQPSELKRIDTRCFTTELMTGERTDLSPSVELCEPSIAEPAAAGERQQQKPEVSKGLKSSEAAVASAVGQSSQQEAEQQFLGTDALRFVYVSEPGPHPFQMQAICTSTAELQQAETSQSSIHTDDPDSLLEFEKGASISSDPAGCPWQSSQQPTAASTEHVPESNYIRAPNQETSVLSVHSELIDVVADDCANDSVAPAGRPPGLHACAPVPMDANNTLLFRDKSQCGVQPPRGEDDVFRLPSDSCGISNMTENGNNRATVVSLAQFTPGSHIDARAPAHDAQSKGQALGAGQPELSRSWGNSGGESGNSTLLNGSGVVKLAEIGRDRTAAGSICTDIHEEASDAAHLARDGSQSLCMGRSSQALKIASSHRDASASDALAPDDDGDALTGQRSPSHGGTVTVATASHDTTSCASVSTEMQEYSLSPGSDSPSAPSKVEGATLSSERNAAAFHADVVHRLQGTASKAGHGTLGTRESEAAASHLDPASQLSACLDGAEDGALSSGKAETAGAHADVASLLVSAQQAEDDDAFEFSRTPPKSGSGMMSVESAQSAQTVSDQACSPCRSSSGQERPAANGRNRTDAVACWAASTGGEAASTSVPVSQEDEIDVPLLDAHGQAKPLPVEIGLGAVSELPEQVGPLQCTLGHGSSSGHAKSGEVGVSDHSWQDSPRADSPLCAMGHTVVSDAGPCQAEAAAPVHTGTKPEVDPLYPPAFVSTAPIATQATGNLQRSTWGYPEDVEASSGYQCRDAVDRACMSASVDADDRQQAEGQSFDEKEPEMQHAVEGIIRGAIHFCS
jgi:hypothetical protein